MKTKENQKNGSFVGRKGEANHKTTSKPVKRVGDRNIRFDRSHAIKAEKNRKNHIAYLARSNPQKVKIIAFAQKIAANKIGQLYKK